ncbi:hypothetical protein GCM10022252_17710 [Streptosporangium oxazolinicum]|uniref:Uncharacterized protein n=1 Tax=Streptosporangium oxazolinicum TaxID=909287 RepID=A0ABP8ALX2_9ACTN
MPVAKLRAEWTDSACGGSTKVALAVVAGDPGRRSRAESGHQPAGGHQSRAVHDVDARGGAVWADCTAVIMLQTPVQVQERMHVHKACATATVTPDRVIPDERGSWSWPRILRP